MYVCMYVCMYIYMYINDLYTIYIYTNIMEYIYILMFAGCTYFVRVYIYIYIYKCLYNFMPRLRGVRKRTHN